MIAIHSLWVLLLVGLLAGCEKQQQLETEAPPQVEPKAAPAEPKAEPKAGPAPANDTAQPARGFVERALPGRPIVPPPADLPAAPPADAARTATGVASVVLKPGTGEQQPRVFDRVAFDYVIWTRDGKMASRSYEQRPDVSLVYRVKPPGLADVLTEMRVGEKRRAWIPAALGFEGDSRFPEGDLTAEVTLERVQPQPEPPETPKDVAAIPPDATVTDSGLASRVLKEGKGRRKPVLGDRVTVHYTAWTRDGRIFDSSVVRGEPSNFLLTSVIPGWREGLQLMRRDETRRLWIPEELAYEGRPGKPAGMLVYDVTLLEIDRPGAAPEAPPDVAGPPPNAKRTKSGLYTRVLKRGDGKRHPGPKSFVSAHYTGWTTDGKAFGSSKPSHKSVIFGLEDVIPGWSEGMQLMVEGEERRMWIPEELAYKGRPGKPAGMLVFDVKLIRILQQ